MSQLGRILTDYLGLMGDSQTEFQMHLMKRLEKVENDLAQQRGELREVRKKLNTARRANEILEERLKHLLHNHNQLRRNQDLEPLDEEIWHPSEVLDRIYNNAS